MVIPGLYLLVQRLAAVFAKFAVEAATTYVIDVEESLAGKAPPVLSLRLPGAIIDGLRVQVDLVPLWHPGDDIVATWLTDAPPPLWAQFTVVGEQLEPIREGAPTTVAALEEVLDAHR